MCVCVCVCVSVKHHIAPTHTHLQVYRRIISCCSHLNYYTHVCIVMNSYNTIAFLAFHTHTHTHTRIHTQVVILCQFLKPVDYELAFATLRNHSRSAPSNIILSLWFYLSSLLSQQYNRISVQAPLGHEYYRICHLYLLFWGGGLIRRELTKQSVCLNLKSDIHSKNKDPLKQMVAVSLNLHCTTMVFRILPFRPRLLGNQS